MCLSHKPSLIDLVSFFYELHSKSLQHETLHLRKMPLGKNSRTSHPCHRFSQTLSIYTQGLDMVQPINLSSNPRRCNLKCNNIAKVDFLSFPPKCSGSNYTLYWGELQVLASGSETHPFGETRGCREKNYLKCIQKK